MNPLSGHDLTHCYQHPVVPVSREKYNSSVKRDMQMEDPRKQVTIVHTDGWMNLSARMCVRDELFMSIVVCWESKFARPFHISGEPSRVEWERKQNRDYAIAVKPGERTRSKQDRIVVRTRLPRRRNVPLDKSPRADQLRLFAGQLRRSLRRQRCHCAPWQMRTHHHQPLHEHPLQPNHHA